MLHVLSPAGLFLSTPCAESSCALLSFAGTLAFSKSFTAHGSMARNGCLLLSGLCFGVATTFRSNGVLSGLLLFEEAIRLVLSLSQAINKTQVLRLLSTGLAGMLAGSGLILPQHIAYVEYCGTDASARPWCEKMLPSIYAFVQDHYWYASVVRSWIWLTDICRDNGFFRYWTLSNVPLFLLGAPMFALMFVSSCRVLTGYDLSFSSSKILKVESDHMQSNPASETNQTSASISKRILNNLALQQFLLATLTLTRAHVQIISRISSAYPVWMWYCGSLFQAQDTKNVRILVRFMIMYAVIQAGLYASFLPPA